MQKLYNINKWQCLEAGKVLSFPQTKPRAVRVDVNCPGECEIHYVNGDGETTFLALVRGRDTLDFTTDGKFAITITGNDLWVHTIDGEDLSFEIIDPVIFTRIVARRARSPEMEMMEARMMQNINRRLERQQNELAGNYERRARILEEKHAAALAAASAAREPAAPGDFDASGALVTVADE